MPARCAKFAYAFLLTMSVSLGVVEPATATHFRFGHLHWQPRVDVAPNAVEVTLVVSARRSAFDCASHPGVCDHGSTGSYPESQRPQIGDTVIEDLGDTSLCFGDGSCTSTLEFDVTSIDVASDWFVGQVTVLHTYASTGTFTAYSDDCCRLSECSGINAHINNPDDSYRVETIVDLGTGNSSPVTSLPPIVVCPQNATCSFTVPGVDDGGAIDFRFSTPAEAGFSRQPGSPDCPNAPSIDPNTGQFTWDTTGCTLGSSVCGAGYTTLYSAQVMLEDGTSKAPVDFLIQLGQTAGCSGNSAPSFTGPTPTCGSTISSPVGQPIDFTVQASDADAGDTVNLNCVGTPPGASFSPMLPTSGSSSASSTFSWTPVAGDIGFHSITCTAGDVCAQQLCSLTLAVVNDCGNGAVENGEQCDDGNTVDGDCCSSGCQFESAGSACAEDGNECTDDQCDGAGTCTHPSNSDPCDDGQYCTDGDVCSGGACIPGGARDCSSLNSQCGSGSCNETSDQCEVTATNEGGACDDGAYCTIGETCSAGDCSGGTARDCSSLDDQCLAGVCNESADQCEAMPVNEGGSCEDGQYCTDGDTCALGVCIAGSVRDCSFLDGDCTTGTCNETSDACESQNSNNGEPCDDANACTVGDVCTAGVCAGVSSTCGNGLVEGTCGEDCEPPGQGLCSDQCEFVPICRGAVPPEGVDCDAADAPTDLCDPCQFLCFPGRQPANARRAKIVAFASDYDYKDTNADENFEIFTFRRKTFDKALRKGATELEALEQAMTQVTDSVAATNETPSVNGAGRFVAFVSDGDLAPGSGRDNIDGNREIFHFELKGTSVRTRRQVTDSVGVDNSNPNLRAFRGNLLVFDSPADLAPDRCVGGSNDLALCSEADCSIGGGSCGNPEGNREVFEWIRSAAKALEKGRPDAIPMRQLTAASMGDSSIGQSVNFNSRATAFTSDADLVGQNPNHLDQIYRIIKKAENLKQISQVTTANNGAIGARDPSQAKKKIAGFISDADLTGENPNNRDQLFLWYENQVPPFVQITDTPDDSCSYGKPSVDAAGRFVALQSTCQLLSAPNPGRSMFFYDIKKNRFLSPAMRGPDGEDTGNPVITKKVRVASFELLNGAGDAQSVCVFNLRKDQFEGNVTP